MAKSKSKNAKTATKKISAKPSKKRAVKMDTGAVERRLDDQLKLIDGLVTAYESLEKQLAETEDDFHARMDKLEERYVADHDDLEEDDEEDNDEAELDVAEPVVYLASSDSVYGESMTTQGHAEGESDYSDPAEDGPVGEKRFTDPDTL